MLPSAPNCRCYVAYQETAMIPVHTVGRRERDGKLFAIVNTHDVPAGVEHSFTFSPETSHTKRPVGVYEPDDDLPKDRFGTSGEWTWVRLDDICPIKIHHVTECDGRIACVVNGYDVPRDVTRSTIKYRPLAAFIADVHPIMAKDSTWQGPSILGSVTGAGGLCWIFLDSLFGSPMLVTPAVDDAKVGDIAAAADRVRTKMGLVDGLTREECFRRYAEAMTHENIRIMTHGERGYGTLANTRVAELALNQRQLAVAREEWTTRLHAKVEAARATAKAADDAVIGWDPYGED